MSQLDSEPSGASRYRLLDEPTSALDLGHPHAVLKTARRQASRSVGVLHDFDPAVQYADRRAFGIAVMITPHPRASCPLVVPIPDDMHDLAFGTLPVLSQPSTPMSDLRTRFLDFRADNPTTRIRTAAREMGVSEASLVATGVDGPAVRLAAPSGGWREMLHAFEAFGDVMALTRNDACVHERHGVYANVSTDLPHGMGLLLNDDIDLRLFCARWASGFAVTNGERHSLQFFDRAGDAVHKVYLTEHSDRAAFDAFVEAHRTDDGRLDVQPRTKVAPGRPDAEVDAAAFLAGWETLQDTHDFFPLLGQHKVGRVQALRLAEGRFTERVGTTAIRQALEIAAEREAPIMVFVGNPGAIQIHTGPVHTLIERGPWFNVLDARFNLHLDETQIADVFVVVKPTEDGDVTAVEAYDADGQQIVQLFGKRKPGIPELEQWREIVAELPRLGVAA